MAALAFAAFAPAAEAEQRADTGRTLLIGASSRTGVTTLGGFHPNRDPTLAAAIDVFGEPSGTRDDGSACSVRWSSIGLTIQFANFGGRGTACEEEFGRAQSAVIKGSRARRWKTTKRLRIGHRETEIRRRHPGAPKRSDGYWLVTGHTPFGACNPTCPFGLLRAKVSHGRVSSFRVWIGAAGE